MPRYALKIEYHGAPFCGWQRQPNQRTVQGEIEAALAKLESDVPSIATAGRTDAGVHAVAQVAHCDMAKDWKPYRLSEAVNFHLKPLPIAIVDCAIAADNWHARFDALERQYMFRVVSRRAPVTVDGGLVWQVMSDLNVDAMREAVGHLLGTHDFTTFRSTICQSKSPVKTLDAIDIQQHPYRGGMEYRFHVRARSFLHNQVRSFVGTLERVGTGRWAPSRVKDVLEARDRAACGPVSPPQGLYLAGVTYPGDPFAR